MVLFRIEQGLTTGRIRVGDRLPAERALAEELGVSRSSVREAVRVLEAMGVVRTAVGSGPDSGATVIADPATSIGSALRLHMATQFLPVPDVVQTRVLLESWAASAAADARPDVTHLHAQLDAMDAPGLSPETFHMLDERFHLTLSSMAGNILVEAMMASLGDSIRGYILDAVPRLDDWAAVTVGLRSEHRAIVQAIGSGRGTRAARLVREHIEGFHALARTDR